MGSAFSTLVHQIMANRNRRLILFIKFIFNFGVMLGIFRFRYDEKAKKNVKSKSLEVYSGILWLIMLLYTPYSFYQLISKEINFAGSDENGRFLTALTNIALYSTLYSSVLTMFGCLFFWKRKFI